MKRLAFVAVFIAMAIGLPAQGYMVDTILEPEVFGRKACFIRVFRVRDDTTVRFRDIDASTLPGWNEDDFREGWRFVVEGDVACLFVYGEPSGQYSIGPDLSLIKLMPRPSDRGAAPSAALKLKLDRINDYRLVHREEEPSFQSLITAEAGSRSFEVVELGPDIILYHDAYRLQIYRVASDGTVSWRRGDSFEDIISFPVTEYAPGRFACVDRTGFVRRFTIGRDLAAYPITAAREKFEAALRDRDFPAICSVMGCQIDPLELQGDSCAIERIIATGDPAFVVNILKYLAGMFAIPFVGRDSNCNPVIAAIDEQDPATLKAILDWRPGLACIRGESMWSRPYFCTPFTAAVKVDSISMCDTLLAYGAVADNDEMISSLPASSYSFARSDAMRAYLKSHGVRETLAIDRDAACNDDRVRVRDLPGLDGAVLGYLSKGESVLTSLVTARDFEVGGSSARWFKIKTSYGLEGWVFGAFLAMSFSHDE